MMLGYDSNSMWLESLIHGENLDNFRLKVWIDKGSNSSWIESFIGEKNYGIDENMC